MLNNFVVVGALVLLYALAEKYSGTRENPVWTEPYHRCETKGPYGACKQRSVFWYVQDLDTGKEYVLGEAK